MNIEHPFQNAEFLGQPFDQGRVHRVSALHRMLLDDQERGVRRVAGEGAHHLLDEFSDMIESRMTVDLRVAGHLKGN